ncbi:MAG: FG-GAP-like repeat-containing protein, partial [Terriglobales bacterium]
PPRFLHFVCLFATLMMVLAVAQSNPVAHANQPGSLPEAKKSHATAGVQRATLAAPHSGSIPLIFLPAVNYGPGGEVPLGLALADLNGDGKLDLVVANECNSSVINCNSGNISGVGVLLGNGDGTFQPAISYNTGGTIAFSVAVGDVNGDGKPDLVVTVGCESNSCGSKDPTGGVSVLLGNGDGTFQPAVTYSSGGFDASFVAIGDVNRDGKLDLVVSNYCQSLDTCLTNGGVSILLGNGDGTFQPAVSYSSGGMNTTAVAIADLNGDGKLDLVVVNPCSISYGCSVGPGEVGVLLGNGDGTFQPAVIYSSGGLADESVAIADVNGDGKLDLVVPNFFDNTGVTGELSVLLGNGNGTFQSPVNYTIGYNPVSVAIADMNGDGIQDLVVENQCSGDQENCGFSSVILMLGNGDGTFQPPVTFYSTGGNIALPSMVVVGDLNGDGKPDVMVANGCGTINCYGSVGVLLNNNAAPLTTISLVSNINPANLGQTVTFTATVASQSGETLSGTVEFTGGGIEATVPLANNQAVFSTSELVGAPAITALYSGVLHVAEGSQSAPLTEFVRSAITKTALTTSGSPSLVGQPVTFTATVTTNPRNGTIPDGELVTFSDGSTTLGSAPLASGTAAFTTSTLSAKKQTITAAYVGDDTFEPSSKHILQVVNRFPSTTALSSSPNPSTIGQPVTLTATVSSGAPGGPTGSVVFKNGTTGLGQAKLSGGTATLIKSNLPVGTLTITAYYSGDAQSEKSSGATTQTVE